MSLSLPMPAMAADGDPLAPVGGAIGVVARIMRQRGLDPANAHLTEDRPDETEAYQHQVNQQAWLNSLALSGHPDYSRYTLDSLDKAQYPEHFRKYIGHLAAARRHNREQRRVPAEERHILRPNILNLIAAGNVGSGKTVAAAAAGAFAVECGMMARFVSHSKYLAWLQPDNAPPGLTKVQVRERYERCDLLVVDDLCNEMDAYATTHVRSHTSDLITTRINSGRATIFTTNLNFEQVAIVLGERLASRIGNRASVLRMTGEDRRKPQTW